MTDNENILTQDAAIDAVDLGPQLERYACEVRTDGRSNGVGTIGFFEGCWGFEHTRPED